jgi:hypothetical protein
MASQEAPPYDRPKGQQSPAAFEPARYMMSDTLRFVERMD